MKVSYHGMVSETNRRDLKSLLCRLSDIVKPFTLQRLGASKIELVLRNTLFSQIKEIFFCRNFGGVGVQVTDS